MKGVDESFLKQNCVETFLQDFLNGRCPEFQVGIGTTKNRADLVMKMLGVTGVKDIFQAKIWEAKQVC